MERSKYAANCAANFVSSTPALESQTFEEPSAQWLDYNNQQRKNSTGFGLGYQFDFRYLNTKNIIIFDKMTEL